MTLFYVHRRENKERDIYIHTHDIVPTNTLCNLPPQGQSDLITVWLN